MLFKKDEDETQNEAPEVPVEPVDDEAVQSEDDGIEGYEESGEAPIPEEVAPAPVEVSPEVVADVRSRTTDDVCPKCARRHAKQQFMLCQSCGTRLSEPVYDKHDQARIDAENKENA